ncbi:MAG TPA: dihydroorotase [Dissulfurispiraceae bacterium]|nr:dihydroorotase [Dissulfurispiraceae bacterium]
MDKRIIIKNGRIIDPAQGIDGAGDIIIEGGRIEEVLVKFPEAANKRQAALKPNIRDVRVIDAQGMIVMPGLVDMHTHLREPGFEYKETIRTGTMAGIKGGFTSLCPMPNTNPANDNPTVAAFVIKKAMAEGCSSVFPIGAITKGQQGQELAEMGLMQEIGCVAYSDDGRPVMNGLVMRRALEYSKAFGFPIIAHCEDLSLSDDGVMNEGPLSTYLGLRGIPAAAEEVMISRDIMLAKLTGGKLHVAHVSTIGAVELVRRAKNEGISVTAETCPHYFSITEKAVMGFDTSAKVNPPLRTDDDVYAIKNGLGDGTIDVIATDHAPHHADEKSLEFDRAPSGISGLETALALSLTLVEQGVLSISDLIRKMTINPSNILGLDRGTLKVGAVADVAILDAGSEFIVEPEKFLSKGRNTPFRGWKLKGVPRVVISKGRIFDIAGWKQ